MSERDLDFELTDDLASFVADLHASEINGEIGWFYDNVWRAKIGDPWNGYLAENDGLPSLGQAARWLCDQALELYPDSEFAKEYLRTHPGYKPLAQAAEPASAIGVVPTDLLSERPSPQPRRPKA